jgi:hypothetical protein
MTTNKDAQNIIEKSGNRLHTQVVNLLRKEAWSVLVSPYYSDNFTEKPREIDIIAERKFDVTEVFDEWLGTLNVRLFIECKYLKGKSVFWFDAKDRERAAERIKKDTGMEHPNYDISKLHHAGTAPVAKLFATDKGGDENDVWSKAINQNLNAFVYYRGKTDLIPQRDRRGVHRPLLHVSYPLIVCNSLNEVFRTDMADETEKVEPVKEPFQLEVNYAYTNSAHVGINEYFLIDVMGIDQLSAFLTKLQNTDVAAIQEKVRWDKRTSHQ